MLLFAEYRTLKMNKFLDWWQAELWSNHDEWWLIKLLKLLVINKKLNRFNLICRNLKLKPQMLGTKGLEFTKKKVHRMWGFNFLNLQLNKLVILYARCFSLSVPGFHETLFRHKTFEQETAVEALTFVSKSHHQLRRTINTNVCYCGQC